MFAALLIAATVAAAPAFSNGSCAHARIVEITDIDENESNSGIEMHVVGDGSTAATFTVTMRRGDASDVTGVVKTEGDRCSLSLGLRGQRGGLIAQIMGGNGPEALLEVRVPANARLRVENVNGRIEIENVQGALDAESSNGRVTATGAGSNLTLHSANGRVDASVTKVGADPKIDLESNNGAVHLTVPKGFPGSVEASTDNGRVHSALPVTDTSNVKLHSNNGSINVDVAQ